MAYQKYHTIEAGETLQDIATQQLGDVTRWRELVRLNNLRYPYIARDETELMTDPQHLLLYGDQIALPVENRLSDLDYGQINQRSKNTVYDMALGMDLGLTITTPDSLQDNIAKLTANDKHSDLQRVTGVDNLCQSLMMRLLTAYGTLPYHPFYGSHLNEYIGQPVTAETAQDLNTEILRCLNTDPRVADCKISDYTILNGSYWAEVTVTPLAQADAFALFVEYAQGQLNVSSETS